MKQMSTFSLLVAMCFLSATFANENSIDSRKLREDRREVEQEQLRAKAREARELAREVLDGRQVVVRVYNNWQEDFRAFKLVPVKLNGLLVVFNQVKLVYKEMAEFAVIVITAKDQEDEAVAAVVSDFIYAAPYKKRTGFSIWPKYLGDRGHKWWTFNDAQGAPFPQSTVEILIGGPSENDPRVWVKKDRLDEKGRLKPPRSSAEMWKFSFIVSHPDYGTALVRPGRYITSNELPETYTVPLVRIGTKAHERSIRGVVVDPEGNPVAGAVIQCTHVRGPGGRTISSFVYRAYIAVVTDKQGRFALYARPDENSEEQGELIPLDSKYHVLIDAPKALGLRRYSGKVANGRKTTITMEPNELTIEPNEYFHTFVFEDGNVPITDLDKLKRIHIRVERQGKPQLNIQYENWKNGGMFPLGIYKALIPGEKPLTFEPIEVTEYSPEELVFKIQDEIVYYGQVVHGITGKPMQRVIVMNARGFIGHNFSIEPNEWDAIHALGAKFSADDEAFEPLRKMFRFTKITRTDENGFFLMSFKPGKDEYFLGFTVLEESYFGQSQKREDLKPDKDRLAEVPVMKLFPSATVIIEPFVEDSHATILADWSIDKNENPVWAQDFLFCYWGQEGKGLIRTRRLKANKVQSFEIPAGLTLRVQLWCLSKYPLSPLMIDEKINLKQGETIDLGRRSFEPAIKVFVKVFNSVGGLVEGVAVERVLPGRTGGKSDTTDESGIAHFYIPPYSKGEFVVQYHEDVKDPNSIHLREGIAYEVGGEEDAGREFTMAISDEMLYQLFK